MYRFCQHAYIHLVSCKIDKAYRGRMKYRVRLETRIFWVLMCEFPRILFSSRHNTYNMFLFSSSYFSSPSSPFWFTDCCVWMRERKKEKFMCHTPHTCDRIQSLTTITEAFFFSPTMPWLRLASIRIQSSIYLWFMGL